MLLSPTEMHRYSFVRFWSRPLFINDQIISFPVTSKSRDKNETEKKRIHSFNIKTGIVKELNEFEYPHWFRCYTYCQFACNPSKSEIFVMPLSEMGVYRVDIINIRSKTWNCGNDNVDCRVNGLWEDLMFVKKNHLHSISPYFVAGAAGSGGVDAESVNYMISDISKSPFESTVVGTSRKQEFLKECWHDHIILPLITSSQNKAFLINKMNLNVTKFEGNTVNHIVLRGDLTDQDHDPNAWNGAIITSDDKIILAFEAWRKPNCEFINIIDTEKADVRKSGIKSPLMMPPYPNCGYYFRATIMSNKDQVCLTVNGYYHKLITENKSIPPMPIALLNVIMKYYCKEIVFFLNVCEERFCYAWLYLDEILNATPQDNIMIHFKYASR